MDEPQVDALVARLDLLEREHARLNRLARRWRAIGSVGLIGLIVSLLAGAQKATSRAQLADDTREIVFAKQFVLLAPDSTPESQRVRAALKTDKDGNTFLSIFGPKLGEGGLMLGVDANGRPGLMFSGRTAERMRISVGADDRPALSLFGKEKTEVRVSVDAENTAGLHVFDEHGERRLRMALTPDGSAALACYDGQQRYRLGLGTGSAGGSSLRFADEDRRDRIGFGVSDTGSPSLYLRDREGGTLFQAPQP
jgi:hypothetical protein